ncbi:MAG: hypothetical protein HWD85_00730 [Flavobacteriaceae bacterium]|nr:hypothetical protein [Flavobacteriaceae bacterium]
MVKIYYPEHYIPKFREELFPLLKPFFKKVNYTNTQRINDYGVSDKDYLFVNTIEKSDVVILTMSWNYYKNQKKTDEAIELIKNSIKHKKKVISFTSGDYGVKIPFYNNLIVLRPNGYKSKLPLNHFGIPVFISDPLRKRFHTNVVSYLNYTNTPIIGFCGQTNYSSLNALKEMVRVIYRNVKFLLKIKNDLPQKVISSSLLRARILNKLKKAKLIDTNFIERKKYRAGVKTELDREKTTQEFYDNIKNTQYTVCVRGGGNFSVRLYEALAMGRIPLFINTDCLLPFFKFSFWKENTVWLESSSINNIDAILLDFHSNLDEKKMNDIFVRNRLFWEERLTLNGYFRTLFQEIL